MKPQHDLIERLETAVANGDIAQRATALRLITDLFMLGSGRFDDEHIALFDDIMQGLIARVESSSRATLGRLMAALPDAPPRTLRDLAFDESIEVAGPVLAQSQRLCSADLLENAKTMGQQHLLALSTRPTLSAEMTDILLDRGDREVASGTARNAGAQFSGHGYANLVERSRDDIEMALSVWARPDLPRMNLVKLFVDASHAVQEQFKIRDPRKSAVISELVVKASSRLLEQARSESGAHADARCEIRAMRDGGELTAGKLLEFAEIGDFERTTTALALMCDLPIELMERIIVSRNLEQLLVLAKAIDLPWDCVKAVMSLNASSYKITLQEVERAFASFTRLQSRTAKTAMQFYRLRALAKSDNWARVV